MKKYSDCEKCNKKRWGQQVGYMETENIVTLNFTCSRCNHTTTRMEVDTGKLTWKVTGIYFPITVDALMCSNCEIPTKQRIAGDNNEMYNKDKVTFNSYCTLCCKSEFARTLPIPDWNNLMFKNFKTTRNEKE